MKSSYQLDLLCNMWWDGVSRHWAKCVSKMAINKCEMKWACCDVPTPSCCPRPGSSYHVAFLHSPLATSVFHVKILKLEIIIFNDTSYICFSVPTSLPIFSYWNLLFATLTQFPYQKNKNKSLILCFFPHSALKTVHFPPRRPPAFRSQRLCDPPC